MHRILLSTCALAIAGPAHAGDFTGFYAGINAGYARGHGHDRAPHETCAPGVEPGSDLPPSAQAAALALRRSEAGRATSPSGR